MSEFPKGWPIRCPGCESLAFTFTSENTGNVRRYRCSKCEGKWVARWKGKPIRSVLGEPTNTKMEDWDWMTDEREQGTFAIFDVEEMT